MTINRTIEDGRFAGHRWIESDSVGTFRPRLASDIIRLRHNGWYVDSDFQDETTCGVVLRLPKSRGFLAGCSDPYNEPAPNCAVLIDNCIYEAEEEAARMSDEIARIYGEACCEDNEEFRAQQAIEDAAAALDEQIAYLP